MQGLQAHCTAYILSPLEVLPDLHVDAISQVYHKAL